MNERDLKILECYDMQFDRTIRGRGSYLCEAEGRTYLLKEYSASEERAAALCELLERLKETGRMSVDVPVRNSQETFVSRNRDGVGYVLKEWRRGRECDVSDREEIFRAVRQMARLHRAFEACDPVEGIRRGLSCSEEFGKRLRELNKIRNYVLRKKGKTEFELAYLKAYGRQAEDAARALALADALGEPQGGACHGDFTQHNVLICQGEVFLTNFDKCHVGSPMEDLYLFMRKLLEKHDWDVGLGMGMLESYDRIRSLTSENRKELTCRFLFPEKFWKMANHYHNSRKTWGVERNVGKLERLLEQRKKHDDFVAGIGERP